MSFNKVKISYVLDLIFTQSRFRHSLLAANVRNSATNTCRSPSLGFIRSKVFLFHVFFLLLSSFFFLSFSYISCFISILFNYKMCCILNGNCRKIIRKICFRLTQFNPLWHNLYVLWQNERHEVKIQLGARKAIYTKLFFS